MTERARNNWDRWISTVASLVAVGTVIFYSGTDHQRLSDTVRDVETIKAAVVVHSSQIGDLAAEQAGIKVRLGMGKTP